MFSWLNITPLSFWLIVLGLGIYLSVLLSTLAVVILENRQPSRTIAWVMVLISIPVGGLVFFYFFGQNIRKKRLISRRARSLLAGRGISPAETHQRHVELPQKYSLLAGLLERMDIAPIFACNELRLFTLGKEMFDSLIDDILAAREHVHVQTYIIDDDEVGRAVRDALMAKAREGLEVRLIYDDVGCWHTPNSFFNEMIEAGVRVNPFLPVRFPSLTHKINYRNHRKIAIIDGRVGYIGGMNFADRYAAIGEGNSWIDSHVRIEGDAVAGLQQIFLTDWYFVTGILINDSRYYKCAYSSAASPEIQPSCVVQIVTSDPASDWEDIMYGLTHVFHNAHRYIYVQTPYFMPTVPVMQALQTAALSGVDVKLMVPIKPDGFWLRYANDSYFGEALEAGVRIYMYKEGFLHSKFIVVDDAFATIGSTNMDYRSFENNFEANAFVYDDAFAANLRTHFIKTLQQCVEISPTEWKERSAMRRVQESLTRILSPLF